MFDPLLVQVVSENEDETLQSSESDDDLGFSLDFITTQNITQLNDNIKININTINDNVEIDKNELYDPFNDKSSDDDIDMIDRQEDTVKQKEKVSDYFCLPTTAPVSTDFSRLSLSRPILKAVGVLGWTTATPIQASAIPLGLQGRDLCASAQTGSGKTAAFMIPVLERLLFRQRNVPTTRVLVLVPTRELASQVMDVTRSLAQFSKVMISLCVGGMPVRSQEQELRKKPDILIATPGRLIDHINNTAGFTLDHIEILIMDEADRMLEDGFTAELQEIIKHTPRKRQTMLFSATMTDNVSQLISLSLNRPIRLHVDNNNTIANKLVQEFIRVRGHREEARPAILVALCSRTYTEQSIIFFRSKAQAHQMKIIFEVLGLSASELHGNLTQPQRLESLEKFRNHESKFLLCTDLASRGLDIAGIKTVINYDMPATYQVYVHRVGRTARAAQGGRAVSLVGEHGRQILKMALDNSKEAVKHRIIPAAVVQKYEKLISDKEGDIIKILADEKRDKELDKMEMQVNRAHNMLEHEEEIMSRPKREWFQSERERKGEKVDTSMTKPPSVKPNGAKRGPFDGLSRHKKRQKLGRIEDAKEISQQKVSAKKAKNLTKATKIGQFKKDDSKLFKKGNKKNKIFSQEIRKK